MLLYVGNLGKKFVSFKISARSNRDTERVDLHAEISPRFRNSQTSWRDLCKSRRDLDNLGEMEDISPRSRLDLEYHKPLWPDLDRQSRRDLGNLGEMEDISPRSRQDLKPHKHHGEISAILVSSQQSRRDGRYRGEISPRFRIEQTSWQDLGKI